ncbi:hypothetical protein EVAR_48516_1 [Eumeta japonica]|uniref:Mariner Mos1 transposase n=1 Tax=Eumeta variegata TaxID=151549 RepID=A0A4C1Z7Q9_EUMVA|nr:hypothetical protein EVAR_48516_1 [Eumeta japonica]
MLTDEFKGQSKSVVVPQNINAVRELIMQDRHVAYREMKASLGISDESWIYAYDLESKQQSTVWVLQDEQNPTKAIRAKSTLKIILHHDNAGCHTSPETTRFLKHQKIELTGHPPNSSDLVSNYFYSFPSVRNKLCDQRFSSREEAVDAFKMHVLEIPQSEPKQCYKNWFQHMQKTQHETQYLFQYYHGRWHATRPVNAHTAHTAHAHTRNWTNDGMMRLDLSVADPRPREWQELTIVVSNAMTTFGTAYNMLTEAQSDSSKFFNEPWSELQPVPVEMLTAITAHSPELTLSD